MNTPARSRLRLGALVAAVAVVLAPLTVSSPAQAFPAGTGSISGKITDSAGNPVTNACVSTFDASGASAAGTKTSNSSGNYTIGSLPAGSFRLRFGCGGPLEFYDDQPSLAAATPVSITDGQATTGVNVQFSPKGQITGSVTVTGDSAPTDVCVDPYDVAGNLRTLESAQVQSDGTYTVYSVPAGPITLRFYDCSGGPLSEQWYSDAPSLGTATAVTVAGGQTTSGINVAMSTLPSTAITGGPAQGAVLAPTTVSFAFIGAAGATGYQGTTGYDCSLDSAAFTACASPASYPVTSGGAHTFAVRAVNFFGADATPATRTFTINRALTAACTAANASVASATAALAPAQASVAKFTKKLKKAKKYGFYYAKKKAKKNLAAANTALAAAQTALATATAAKNAAC